MLGPPDSDSSQSPSFRPKLIRQVSKNIVDVSESDQSKKKSNVVNVLMVGTGEYTTGYVHGAKSDSDKGAGVVALTLFDLRQRKKVGRLGLCGSNGTKFAGLREHLKEVISNTYDGLDVSLATFPEDNISSKPKAYIEALESFQPGDCVTIFTPDDTHFEIALECIRRRLHVLIAKPAVLTLTHHRTLCEAAELHDVIVAVEVHKRWDPIYVDARDRIKGSWVSGRSSDISYYLNTHHIDFHEWSVGESSRPVRVVGTASTGVAQSLLGGPCEDTITLTVLWENLQNPSYKDQSGEGNGSLGFGTAVYTASWIAPRSDVHSQQRFFYMGQTGEVTVDQAHRGYTFAADDSQPGGLRSLNPLFMKYTPTDGKFSGQTGYGYRSIEAFIDAANTFNRSRDNSTGTASTALKTLLEGGEEDEEQEQRQPGNVTVDKRPESELNGIASLSSTFRTTAILEAGRMSLDNNGRPVEISYDEITSPCKPTGLKLVA